MAENRRIVIIIDGAAPMQELAENIAAIIGGYQGYSATVIQAESFSGSDLLPAYAFFLGCEKPNPFSFSYMEDFLKHINLAGRYCGIFSSSAKALEYLSVLVSDSETTVGKPFLTEVGATGGDTLRNWIQGIFKMEDKNERFQS